MTTDVNLLFGVIAMQLDFIDSDQFAQGCAFWSTDKSKSLGEILEDRGWLTEADRKTLEETVKRKLDKNDGDIMHTLSVVADACVRDMMRNVEDDEVNQAMARLSPSPSFVQVREVDVSIDERSHYTLTRVYGQGGLGRVWLARDKNLNREVALKEIRPDVKVDGAEMNRFVTEAQITGQLDHPNIIPIYELGRQEEGKPPFYTMRFMRGQTLRDAVKEYHRKRKKGGDSPMDLQRLLNSFVGMCNALAFAHSKGVVHRDLKPANVMLGAFGEVVVLDWGLAKMMDQPEEETQVFPSIRVSEGEHNSRTQMGQTMGTPAFMAPEQAEGRLDHIDSRSDIYGLGATLFNILTDDTPHKGKTTIETLQGIVKGAIPSPRDVDSSVPPALDAICSKAMQRVRVDRYQSAQDLADDIQRWLVDEPVSAYPEPFMKRAGRWIRRHRTLALSVATTLLVITVASTLAAVLIGAAHQETKEALRKEEIAKGEAVVARDAQQELKEQATRLLRGSRETVDTMLTQVAGWLAYQKGMDKSREILLREAAAEYRRFASERSDDPNLRLESGRAFLRLGDVLRRMGKPEEAIKAFEDATAVLDELASTSAVKLEVARARMELGGVLRSLGENEKAASALEAARKSFEALSEVKDLKVDALRYRAECLMLHARLVKALGDADQALELAEQASAVFQSLMADHAARVNRHGLANARVLRGELLMTLGRSADAMGEFNSAIAMFDGLLAEDADHPDFFEGRAIANMNLGSILQTLGDFDNASQSFEEAVRDYEILKAEQPHIPHYYQNLANAKLRLAHLQIKQGNNEEAQTTANLTLQREMNYLLTNFRPLPQYYENAVYGTMTLVAALLNRGEYDEVDGQLQVALSIYNKQLLPVSEEPRYVRGVGYVHMNVGRAWLGLNEPANAIKKLKEAISFFNKAMDMGQASSKDIYSIEGLAWAHYYLGDAHYLVGQAKEARAAYDAARDNWELLPEDAEHQFNLAWLLMNCRVEEVCDVKKAVAIGKRLSDQVPGNPRFGMLYGGALLRAGDAERCVMVIETARRKRDEENCFDLVWLALAYHASDDADKAREHLTKALATDFFADNQGNWQLLDLISEVRLALGIVD